MGRDEHSAAIEHIRQWAEDRRFVPSLRYTDKVLDQIEIHHDDDLWTYVACDDADPCADCGALPAHLDCIVIAVDGACHNNGTPYASAAVGVFVGKNSPHNISTSLMLKDTKATSQIAELNAGILGLQQALQIQRQGFGEETLHQVVIKADSEYLVKGMTEWASRWKKNGYRTSTGKPVANLALFDRLNKLVEELNDHKVEVIFWHVTRDKNQEADRLASRALHTIK
ncbi:ribonuclease H-like domain-containing protein [Microdochium trichocladiopsis]|uniref:ribonuclease H n=1 Tax=Microdochium trichocladiopsis TaxID=1682393 RepID=A0A9P9BTY7_9PEZI|nr:ribonuclease H-like domain-containing protein [Microdochium trichocladiopsis]KAH7035957.1 ribonuclease H-like domain-containing protein [Microdochium trichocladiopsis]